MNRRDGSLLKESVAARKAGAAEGGCSRRNTALQQSLQGVGVLSVVHFFLLSLAGTRTLRRFGPASLSFKDTMVSLGYYKTDTTGKGGLNTVSEPRRGIDELTVLNAGFGRWQCTVAHTWREVVGRVCRQSTADERGHEKRSRPRPLCYSRGERVQPCLDPGHGPLP